MIVVRSILPALLLIAASADVVGALEQSVSMDGTVEDIGCVDKHELCSFWAEHGECEKNPPYMLKNCQSSCDSCEDDDEDEDEDDEDEDEEEEDEYGVVQVVDASRREDVKKVLEEMRNYFDELRTSPDTSIAMHKVLRNGACKNRHANCAYWALLGECEKNVGYMQRNCAPVCKTCEQSSVDTRCPVDPKLFPDTWQAGSLDEFFLNVTTLPQNQQYEPVILSRPTYLEGDTEETADYNIGPWVVTLDKFVTEEEADRLVELGAKEGYERSSDVGKMKPDGTFESNVNSGRTSTNAWCQNDCYEDDFAQSVIHRISDLTNIPETNSEYLQLLRYLPGQFYQTHHDYIAHQRDRQQGVRLLTVFLYLNDVEEGGGTDFPSLGITVQPKKGRALIWPSVLNDKPHDKDFRTDHQALPVKKGIKFGANAWIHMRDFKGPNRSGCQ